MTDEEFDPALQVLLALRFYATGNIQIVVGDLHGVHLSTVCRVIHRISRLIANWKRNFIKFPLDGNFRTTKQAFYAIAGFPGVEVQSTAPTSEYRHQAEI